MGEGHADERIQRDGTGTGMKRRGILRAAGMAVGTVVAGFVAKQASAPVAAVTDTTFVATGATTNFDARGTAFTGVDTTIGSFTYGVYGKGSTMGVRGEGGSGVTGVGVKGESTNGIGVWGVTSGGYGVSGRSAGNLAAVYGENMSGFGAIGVQGETGTYGYGVYGHSAVGSGTAGVTGAGYGIYGLATSGTGVHGESTSGSGVQGLIPNTSSAVNTIAVSGVNQSIGGGGFGVYGSSGGGPGVFGTTTAAQNAGLAGIVSAPNTAAFAGTATVPTAFAGFFTGDVFVNGNFTVQDPTRKHGAIAHPDGSHRILYSMESPESWLEDFGKGHLVSGRAEVWLDADFAAVVQTDAYYVFLTDRGVRDRLTVTGQDPTGFTVEAGTADASGDFYWRVVARPKTTNKAARMAKFTIPEIMVPQPPAMPSVPVGKVPDAPPLPAPSPRTTGPAGVSPIGSPATAPQGSGTTPGSTTSPVQPVPPPRP